MEMMQKYKLEFGPLVPQSPADKIIDPNMTANDK